METYFFLKGKKIGIINIKAMTEKTNPPITPTANENQKGSSLPSIKKGIIPIIVDNTVSMMGIIL